MNTCEHITEIRQGKGYAYCPEPATESAYGINYCLDHYLTNAVRIIIE